MIRIRKTLGFVYDLKSEVSTPKEFTLKIIEKENGTTLAISDDDKEFIIRYDVLKFIIEGAI